MANAGNSAPISISIQRQNSTSPRQQTSNLTSALQSTSGNEGRPSAPMSIGGSGAAKSIPPARKDSISMSGLTPQYGSGAVPMPVNGRNQPRRESVAGSAANGMSWGGVSMNSWIRDDIIMQGSSPYAGGYQSPSYHSSSYLPKLEANFMKDFTCCGLTLPSLHDLLQHYEESHAQQIPPTGAKTLSPRVMGSVSGGNGSSGSSNNNNNNNNNNSNTTQSQKSQPQSSTMTPQASFVPNGGNGAMGVQRPMSTNKPEEQHRIQTTSQDMEAVEDMEMDDIDVDEGEGNYSSNPAGYAIPETEQFPPTRSQFGQANNSRVPPLNLSTLDIQNNNPYQSFQGMRNQSGPNTPQSAARPLFHNNPTVSSVNTPTLSAHPLQHQFRKTPDSSAPGTPCELDPDFLGELGSMSMDNPSFMTNQSQEFGNYGYNMGGGESSNLCIDDPAKRLYSPGGASNQQSVQNRLGNAQYGPNSDIARRIREQQRKVGLADTVNGMNGEEPKPFRCPVIGCEKAYKNQNGLKYHKSHGHNNQQLHENADGTFSIVDPTTLSPYPGTLGMEKEKPYKCEVCGKRYKNLNGLKYHKTHSPPCNPELKLNAGIPINTSGMNVNVAGAGAGLPGIGEELL